MASRRLHLVVDPDLGPALWVREQTRPGRSRASEDLAGLREQAPAPLAHALSAAPAQLRHRVRLFGPGSGSVRRVPALPLPGSELTELTEAVSELLRARFGEGTLEQVAQLVADGAGARLTTDPAHEGEELAAMPDLLAATLLDLEAQELVEGRHLRVVAVERFGRPALEWRAPDRDRPELLHAWVDAHARAGCPAHLAKGPSEVADDRFSALPALASQAALEADLPSQRSITAAFDAFLDSGRIGVRLTSTDSDLVVRLFETPVGTAWPLQTCLREADGTIHPVADLRAVGDLTAAGAAEASAAVMRLAPTVRAAAVDDTGVDWLLTTAEASAFLAHDTAALEDEGVTVLLPRTWTKQRTTLRPQEAEGEEAASAKTSAGVGLGSMASFRWRVAVGDTELTEEEMQIIREAQTELVQLRGQWVRLDPVTLRAAERFLDAFTSRTQQNRAGGHEDGSDGQGGPTHTPQAADGRTPPRAAAPAGPLEVGYPEGARPAELAGLAPWAEMFSLILSPDAADVDFGVAALTAGGTNGLARLMPGGSGAYPHPQPTTLCATLRPYQLDGLNWLWALDRQGLGGILADDMGLGKTMQVLALLCREREGTAPSGRGRISPADPSALDVFERDLVDLDAPVGAAGSAGPAPSGPTLLVCPMSVVGAWQREAAKFAPHLAVHVHHGGDRLRDESFAAGAADLDLVITTYSLLARDLSVLSAVDWQRIVYDEAQHLKTPGAQVTRAARALQAPHRLALTGTPVENKLADLHALMEVVNPGLLGSTATFRERVANPIESEGDAGALTRLKFVTGPFILRRVKTDRSIIADLPEKTELTRVVNLSPEQAGLYQALVDELMTSLEEAQEKERRTLVVSTITRLKQVCNHPAHYLGDGSALLREGQHRSGKLELVDDLLETAFAEGQKALLFTQFTAFGHLLVPYWAEKFGLAVPFLHGGVSKRDRDAMVADFQSRPDEPGLMLLSLRAGGTGLTLTAANHVVHLDRWWNPAVENQATDRAFRIGQRRDVSVHKLVSAGTVEERIDSLLTEKQALSDLTIAPGEDWLADLDDADLHQLLSLDEEQD